MGQLVRLVSLQVKFILWKRIHNKKQELHAPPGKYCEGDTVEAKECVIKCPTTGLNKSNKVCTSALSAEKQDQPFLRDC